jgi:hypothetical protein
VSTAEPPPPILVTGTHYSATTWVGRVLARAPRVGYIHEPFNPTVRPGICRARFRHWYTYLSGADGDAYLPALRDTLRFRYSYRDELASLRSGRDAARMARDAANFARWRLLGYRPLVKDPIALLSAGWLHRTFGMRVVVTVRHPAAFAHSMKRRGDRHPFGDFLAQPALMSGPLARFRPQIEAFAAEPPDVIDAAGLLWRLLAEVMAGYRERHPDWLFVRHENLMADPEARFAELFAALGLPFTDPVRRFVAATTAAENRSDATRVRHPDYVRRNLTEVAERWKRELSAEEVDRVRCWVEPVVAAFYARENGSPK